MRLFLTIRKSDKTFSTHGSAASISAVGHSIGRCNTSI